jgi:uncharacterized protein (DUF2235 family)
MELSHQTLPVTDPRSRNLVVLFDGTNNEFGIENTSIVRLAQVLQRDSHQQLYFYDPGVGTLPEPTRTTRLGKWLSKVAGLAFGQGLMQNVEDAYRFLMNHWQPGDRVFLFGFSRGAYTARALASLLHMFGLLPSGADNLLPYLMRHFSTSGKTLKKGKKAQEEFWTFTDEFRRTFAQPAPGGEAGRFPTHFIGVFDTVSSLGWVWDPVTVPFSRNNPSIHIVRHAVAIDERRWFFRQNTFSPRPPPADLQERWFAGVHSDVGGGYLEADGGLWREAYAWMLNAAMGAGLQVDPTRADFVWRRSPVPAQPWCEPQHESLTAKWWPAEFFPKRRYLWTKKRKAFWPSMGLGRCREVRKGAVLHESAMNRIRDVQSYAPPNLPRQMVEGIKAGTWTSPDVP